MLGDSCSDGYYLQYVNIRVISIPCAGGVGVDVTTVVEIFSVVTPINKNTTEFICCGNNCLWPFSVVEHVNRFDFTCRMSNALK